MYAADTLAFASEHVDTPNSSVGHPGPNPNHLGGRALSSSNISSSLTRGTPNGNQPNPTPDPDPNPTPDSDPNPTPDTDPNPTPDWNPNPTPDASNGNLVNPDNPLGNPLHKDILQVQHTYSDRFFIVVGNIYRLSPEWVIRLCDHRIPNSIANVPPAPITPNSSFTVADQELFLHGQETLYWKIGNYWHQDAFYASVEKARISLAVLDNLADPANLPIPLDFPHFPANASDSGTSDSGSESWPYPFSPSSPLTSSSCDSPAATADGSLSLPGSLAYDIDTKRCIDIRVDDHIKRLKAEKKRSGGEQQSIRLRCTVPKCDKVHRRPQVMKEHLYSHAGINPYTCQYRDFGCDHRCNTSSNLKRHERGCSRRSDGALFDA